MINWLFISTGIFLGWSLGANHAVNVFGTAVASRMVRFKTAAIVAGIFVTIGAVLSGAGTTRTLNTLGAVNALAGCFTVALAVGLTITWMTALKLPVSTSQAVVGGIVGWNLFTGSPTDTVSLSRIVSTWIVGPVLAAVFSFILFKLLVLVLHRKKFHILHIDAHTRTGLLLIGALASYMLGANNIANVMGMFVAAAPFPDIRLWNLLAVSGSHQLFLVGGLAIAVGIYTYGERVMATVGKDLYKITPLAGLVVILAETIVLFLFTSESLESFLLHIGLPTIPLVPLSSTQVVIGSVIGVGVAKGVRSINYHVLLKIALGWVVAPVVSGLVCFVLLFVVQNVFEQQVVKVRSYTLTEDVVTEISRQGVDPASLRDLTGDRFDGSAHFRRALEQRRPWSEHELVVIFDAADLDSMRVDSLIVIQQVDTTVFTPGQRVALTSLHGKTFLHRWQLDRALENESPEWLMPVGPNSEVPAKRLRSLRTLVYDMCRIRE
jgi:inorganic phosphate transporter, PiT family